MRNWVWVNWCLENDMQRNRSWNFGNFGRKLQWKCEIEATLSFSFLTFCFRLVGEVVSVLFIFKFFINLISPLTLSLERKKISIIIIIVIIISKKMIIFNYSILLFLIYDSIILKYLILVFECLILKNNMD